MTLTALEIYRIETEKNFVVRHNVRLLLDLAIWALRMPCSHSNIVILRERVRGDLRLSL